MKNYRENQKSYFNNISGTINSLQSSKGSSRKSVNYYHII